MTEADADKRATWFATGCAASLIANQVAGKATRDAVFLSTYDVTDLPLMYIVAAVVSVVVVLGTSKLFVRWGPGRVAPLAFGLSAALSVAEWFAMAAFPRVATVVVYLHLAVFGAILISLFWSVVNERFDPRSAKRRVGQIAAGGTFGGLLGGLLAERVAAIWNTEAMLVGLAVLHGVCLLLVRGILDQDGPSVAKNAPPSADGTSAWQILVSNRYLVNIAGLVTLSTVAGGLVDYLFKMEASARFSDSELMRFFAAFYTASAFVTFLVQTTCSRFSLERLGLTRTIATLPLFLSVGGTFTLMLPGFWSAVVARGGEGILRSSLFRSAFELLYTPLLPSERRATKSIVDVGFDRFGDALGGALIRGVLGFAPALVVPILSMALVLISLLALIASLGLRRGYVRALERRLLSRAAELELSDDGLGVVGTNPVLQSLTHVNLKRVWRAAGVSEVALRPVDPQDRPPSTEVAVPPTRSEPLVDTIVALRSGDAQRVMAALASPHISPLIAGHVIVLLAWDEVYPRAQRVLRGLAPRIVGQLVDHLLDPHEEFAIRRRIPRVLRDAPSVRGVDGLIRALGDKRFEVRYQSGRALALIHRHHPDVVIPRTSIYDAVVREVAVDERVWRTQRLLDAVDDEDDAWVDDYLRGRSNRCLEHVFTMLSLVLPSEPLRISFRGLHTQDATLRGTSLEYLESVLPERVRVRLWPFLEDGRESPAASKPREEVLRSLMLSRESIEMSLAAIRERVVAEDSQG